MGSRSPDPASSYRARPADAAPSASTPTCAHCGYPLTGLRVDDACPECNRPVWSNAPSQWEHFCDDASTGLKCGVASIILFFLCLGPIAGVIAIPAILKAKRIKRVLGPSPAWPKELRHGSLGGRLGWGAAVLSIVALASWLVVFGVAVVSGSFP